MTGPCNWSVAEIAHAYQQTLTSMLFGLPSGLMLLARPAHKLVLGLFKLEVRDCLESSQQQRDKMLIIGT